MPRRRLTLSVHDPEHAALRKATRTAIVMPLCFAFCLVVVDSLQMAMLAGFGTFSMLAFADFGGPPRARARAYVGLTAVGAILIPVATLLSGHPWLAGFGMALVAFTITFAGSLGGYFAAGGTAATLAFVLSVALQADASEIPARLAGWGLAGAASTAAALFLWPRYTRSALRRRSAEGASAVADVLGAWAARPADPATLADRLAAAETATTALAETLHRLAYRPAGPTVHDQSLAYLVAYLRRDCGFARRVVESGPAEPGADLDLAVACETALRELAAFLEGRGGTIGLDALDAARQRHGLTVEQTVGEADASTPVLELARRSFDVRILSYAVLTTAANALLASGRHLPELEASILPIVPAEGSGHAARRLGIIFRSHLDRRSVWLQAALRAALGLGVAVLIALLGQLQHAFWVVLGTLTVMKSSAVTTSFTAWQALLGTCAGFALSSAFIAASGDGRTALWVALPICVFLAVYTPTAVHAAVGQAMFTITVVVMFNLIEPDGWRVGLVRVEDILIGAATSVVVGILLWPHGASGQLRARLGALLEGGGTYVRNAVESAVGETAEDALISARTSIRDWLVRADEAFATFLNERGPKTPPPETWIRILGAGHYLRFVGDAVLARKRAVGEVAAPPAAARALDDAAADLERRLTLAGEALADPRLSGGQLPVAEPALDGILDGLDPAAAPATAVGLVWAAEWIADVRGVLDSLEEPLAELRATGKRRWWA